MSRRCLVAAAVAVMISACGVPAAGPEVSSVDSELVLFKKGVDVPERDCRVVTARPMVSGTLRSAPEAQMLEVAPVGSAVQSMFFETTALGPELRHGLVEFDVPAIGGRIVSATLRFSDRHGWQLQEVPEDVHRLSLYDADGVITVDDWIREGPAGLPEATGFTFSTDLNELNPVERRFDISSAVRAGHRLGARFQLDDGTAYASGSYGSAFEGFRIELKVCGENALPNGLPTGDPE